MRFVFLSVGVILQHVCLFAQDTITYYNEAWETVCCKDSASFYRISNNDFGIFDGQIMDYYITGELQMEGYYKNWLEDGIFTWYYKNGKRSATIEYLIGRNNNMLKGWDSLGVKTVKNGTGQFTWYHSFNMKPSSSGSYKNGIKVGNWVYYNLQGKRIEEVVYDECGEIVSCNYWDDAGEKQLVVNGTGTLVRYYKNGRVKFSVTWKDNKTEEKAMYYYENGKIKSEGFYLNGKMHGLWNYYYSNGQRSSSRVKSNGKDNGKVTWWVSGGTMKCTGYYTNGQPTGEWIWYNAQGYEQSRFTY